MAPTYETSRRDKTNPEPWDQVFFLSQQAINDSLANMYAKETNPEAPLRHFARSDSLTGQRFHAYLDAPQITIPVVDRSFRGWVYLHLKCSRGDCFIRDGTNKLQNFDVGGWDLVFMMRIKHKELSQNALPWPYRNNPQFNNAIFSVSSLYLDASDPSQNAGAFVEHESRFGAETSRITGTIKSNLVLFMQQGLNSASMKERNVIGYTLTSARPQTVNSTAPSFIPATVDTYTYPWIDPTGSYQPRDELPQNALALLTKRDPGAAARIEPVIQYSGAFVDRGATFCMNRTLFWNEWLLPLLKEVNKVTQLIPQIPILQWGPKLNWLRTGEKWTFGAHPKHPNSNDSYFDWHAQPGPDGPKLWTWQGEILTTQKKAQYKYRGRTWTDFIIQKSKSSTSVEFQPGGRNIIIKGRHTFHYEFRGDRWIGGRTGGFKPRGSWTVTTTDWHITLEIQGVNDGGLQIVHVDDGCKTSKTQQNHYYLSTALPGFRTEGDRIKTHILQAFKQSVRRIANKLNVVFQNQNKLVLPGAGIFAMTYPMFNSRGDLLVELTYISENIFAPNSKLQVETSNETFGAEDSETEGFNIIPALVDKYPSRQPILAEQTMRLVVEQAENLLLSADPNERSKIQVDDDNGSELDDIPPPEFPVWYNHVEMPIEIGFEHTEIPWDEDGYEGWGKDRNKDKKDNDDNDDNQGNKDTKEGDKKPPEEEEDQPWYHGALDT